MGRASVFKSASSPAGQVEQQVASAFDVIKKVADHLEELNALATHVDSLDRVFEMKYEDMVLYSRLVVDGVDAPWEVVADLSTVTDALSRLETVDQSIDHIDAQVALAELAKTTAEQIAITVENSRQQIVQLGENIGEDFQAWLVQIEALRDAAIAARTAAQSAQTAAEAARTGAQAAQAGAVDARNAAAASRDAAAGSAQTAAGHVSTAASHASAADAAANDAGTYAIQAAGSAVAANNSALAAQNHANTASTHKDEATAAANLARDWANKATNQVVADGLYSARHWAEMAANVSTGAMQYMGGWSAASGSYPPSPQNGWMYKVTSDGTVQGVAYAVGDQIIYNGTGWDKIDNTDAVTSVAGRVGAVELTVTDIAGLGALALQSTVHWNDLSGVPNFSLSGHTHTKGDVGLSNVDNTSDMAKPVSTATATALDAKADKTYVDTAVSGRVASTGGTVSGTLKYSSAVAPVADEDLVTKKFVEDAIDDLSLGEVTAVVQEVRIAVIGDSIAAQNYGMAPSWPTLVEEALRCSQIDAHIYNFAVPAATFHTAVNTPNNGATQLQKAISVKPHIVIVSLGINETFNRVGNLTLAQMTSARQTLFDTLRAQIPNVKIVYMEQVVYDTSSYSSITSSTPNRAVMPYYFALPTSGIFAGCYSSEILDNPVAGSMASNWANWFDLRYPLTAGNSLVDVGGRFDMWRIARMGGCVSDGLHLTGAGQILMRGYIMKTLQSPLLAELLPGITSNPTANVNDPDEIFTGMFTKVSTSWNYRGGEVKNVLGIEDSLFSSLRPTNWHLPRDVKWLWSHSGSKDLRIGTDAVFVRSILNAKPNTVVQVSVDGGAWQNTADTTNSFGNQISGNDAFSLRAFANKTTVFRYRVDNIVCDPLSLTITSPGHATKILTGYTTVDPTMLKGVVLYQGSGTVVLTIPPNSTTPLPLGCSIKIINTGTGAVGVMASSPVNISSPPGKQRLSVNGPAMLELVQYATNEWMISGDLQ